MSENNKRAPQVLQDKLAESIKALEEFAREECPLREQEGDLPPPEWMVKDTSSVDHTADLKVRPAITESPDSPEKMDQDVGVDSNAAAGSPEGTENATEAATEDGDESRTSEDDTLTNAIDEEGISHEGGPRPAVPNAGTAESLAEQPGSSLPDVVHVTTAAERILTESVTPAFHDDPCTRESMHPAVVLSLEVYTMALSHDFKTPKMADFTLDCITLLVKNKYVSGRAGGRAEAQRIAMERAESEVLRGDANGDENKEAEAARAGPRQSLLQKVADAVTQCSVSSSEMVQIGMCKCLLAMMKSPKCGVHEAPMLMAIRATFHIYLVAKSQQAKDVSKSSLLEMQRSVFNRMETYDAMARSAASAKGKEKAGREGSADDGDGASVGSANDRSTAASAGEDSPDFGAFASQFHTDSYLIFRALCKLSAKSISENDEPQAGPGAKLLQPFSSGPVDPLALTSKVLSMELILSTLEHCGPAFCTGEKFVYAVQHYLCVSLLKNCMSNHTEVAYLSLKIFLLLVYKYKSELKSEIEVFVANIFLRILESPNSSYQQKSLVLEALRALCSDPVILTQLFLNYDCDFDAVNLYRDIIQNLTKLSGKNRRNQYNANVKDVSEDVSLSVAGLEVLVVTLRAFLKALDLPGGKDNLDLGEDATTTSGLRGRLKLDVGLALRELTDTASGRGSEDLHLADSEISEGASEDAKALAEGTGAISKSNAVTNDDVAGQIVDAFDKKRTQQQQFETGRVRFTLSPKSGLLYFIKNGFVRLDAKAVAQFLFENKDDLDKTQIGEILGREPDAAFVKDEGLDADEGGKGFFIRVLHYYSEAMDLNGLLFDNAIRYFLSGFRLPGEAQKIDRIMEKFAERYTRQNEDTFPSADTAFILAFSVIMLQTDLHNPSIKPERRMTIESFIRNNRGISVDGGDLPSEFLEGIFKRVQATPFTLKEDDDAREKEAQASGIESSLFEAPAFFGTSAEERKKEKFRKEREALMAATEALFKRRPNKSSADKASAAATAQMRESVSPSNVVKPMFDVTWGALMGTLSQVLETAEDENSIALCLIAFVYSIRLSSHSGMSLARDTFVNALAKFTTLGSIKEMKYKNIESIRTLLSIAIVDGDHLGESWGPVLQCVSQLGRLQLYASGLDADDNQILNMENPQGEGSTPSAGFFRSPTQKEISRGIEENNGRAILSAVNEMLIDKVFSSTVSLSVGSIYHFIEQLIAVSMAEISGDNTRGLSDVTTAGKTSQKGQASNQTASRPTHGEGGPRVFSLQRLVEVADFNMDVRPRVAWKNMWEMMGNHFARIGCHENATVSMYAIDALRQLSFKFLEKVELADFNFQRLFLQPFLDMMENPTSREDIRELILRCVDNMIRSMSHSIRSGWKIFFSILTLSASDSSEKISTLGLAILQRLLDEHLDQLCRLTSFENLDEDRTHSDGVNDGENISALKRKQRNANAEDFVGLCHASLSFVQTEPSDNPLPIGLSMRALCHTACYADLIAEEKVHPPVSGAQSNEAMATGYTYDGLSDDEALEMVLWRPILDGLAAGICSTARSSSGGVGCLVQRGSVVTMRAILLRHGARFSNSQWAVILRQVVLPAIQIGAEYDVSPVMSITSESPGVSSLDFLNEALPLPPNPNDEGLLKFSERQQSDGGAPDRALGISELLVEASFADLRHGGDGNLSQAHDLAKEDIDEKENIEQPFPNSWVATTAPIALGMLTDLFSEFVLSRGEEGRILLWPIILEQLRRWSIGYPPTKSVVESIQDASIHDDEVSVWTPSEALVRIGCKELFRMPDRLGIKLPMLSAEDSKAWPKLVFHAISDTLSKNVVMELQLHDELVKAKFQVIEDKKNKKKEEKLRAPQRDAIGVVDSAKSSEESVVMEKVLVDGREISIPVSVTKLDSGTKLYPPPRSSEDKNDKSSPSDDTSHNESNAKDVDDDEEQYLDDLEENNYLDRYVPPLKVKCIASHCLQHGMADVIKAFFDMVGEDEVGALLGALEESRIMSERASLDEDLAHAFQEALLAEWGGGVEEVESTLASVGGILHKGGSEMFFLAQEAGANKAIINILSQLCCRKNDEASSWDPRVFAEPILLKRMVDVLKKFLISEKDNAEFIDPNVWRIGNDGGGKYAVYCTTFAGVCAKILQTVLDFDEEQFDRHKNELFPIICSLIRVQSEEIRGLVQEILSTKVARVLGIMGPVI